MTARHPRQLTIGGLILFLAVAGAWAAPADQPAQGQYVTRKEYNQLLEQLKSVKAELSTLKSQNAAPPQSGQDYFKQSQEQLQRLQALAQAAQQGTTKMVLAGDAGPGFTSQSDSDSSFNAGFGPMLLWELNEKTFMEVGLDFDLSDSSTDVGMGAANVSYLLTNWLAVGVGKFNTFFGAYHTHLDPPWIGKLPDDPLPYGDNGIAPDGSLGAFGTGAVAIGTTRLNYGVYVSNGPRLVTDDSDSFGSLSWDNYDDNNTGKAVGGRVGFLPIPGLEVGYSIECAQTSPHGFPHVHALLQGLDLNLVHNIDQIKGRLTARAEWVFSHVADATYDPTGAMGFGPVRLDNNNRNGGYVELAYRPSMVQNRILRNFEFVCRYDRLEVPAAAPNGGREYRVAPGVDYWISPSTVVKLAYEYSHLQIGDDSNALLFQFGLGF